MDNLSIISFYLKYSPFMILKLFNYVISNIIEDVIVKNSLIYIIYAIMERKLAFDYGSFCSFSQDYGKNTTIQLNEEINAKEENLERESWITSKKWSDLYASRRSENTSAH